MKTKLCALSVALLLGAGCGLIDSDITDFDIALPEKKLTVDTADWQLSGDATFPAIDCSVQDMCGTAISVACSSANCFGSCDGQNCMATVLVSLSQEINLKEEQPELQQVDDRALIEVKVKSITYTVSENTFNQPSPEMTVYLAPIDVMNPGNPLAEPIGTIPAVPSMTTVTEEDLLLTDSGRDTLRRFMEDFATPFNILIGTEVELVAGQEFPRGRIVAVVNGTASAGL